MPIKEEAHVCVQDGQGQQTNNNLEVLHTKATRDTRRNLQTTYRLEVPHTTNTEKEKPSTSRSPKHNKREENPKRPTALKEASLMLKNSYVSYSRRGLPFPMYVIESVTMLGSFSSGWKMHSPYIEVCKLRSSILPAQPGLLARLSSRSRNANVPSICTREGIHR